MVIIKRRRLFKKKRRKNNSKMLLAHEKNWSRKKDISGPTFFQWRKPKNKLRRRGNFSRIIALTRVAFTAMSGEKKEWICTSLERQINPHWSTTLEHSGLFLENVKNERSWRAPPPWRPTATTAAIQLTRPRCRPVVASGERGGVEWPMTSRHVTGRGGAWNPALVFQSIAWGVVTRKNMQIFH